MVKSASLWALCLRSSDLGALPQVLGLLGRGTSEVVRCLLSVDEGGPYGALQILELLQPVTEARHLLAHPLVLRVVALELVGNRVQEIVNLVRVVAAEAVLELLAPYIYRSNRHIGSPRHRSYEFFNND